MSLDFWWLEDRTATTQRVSFRVTATGVCGANGVTVSCDPLVADGTGYVDVPVTNQAGSLSITYNGSQVDTGEYPPFAGPSDNLAIGIVGCQSQDYEFLAGHWLSGMVDLAMQTGDKVYEAEAYNKWGEAGMTSCLTTPTQANWYQHHRQPHRNPGWLNFGHKRPMYSIEDDHDILDRWDGTDTASTATAVGNYVTANGGTREAALAAIFGIATNAIDAYRHQGPYYAFTWGNARIIVPNLMRYTDPVSEAAGSGKTRMGATQLAWFLAELERSETFKIVVSSKVLFNGANDDAWYPDPADAVNRPGFYHELATVLAHIKTNGITGMLFCEGDTHHPMVNALTPAQVASKLGVGVEADYDHVVCINPTPSGKIQDHNITATATDGCIWKKQKSGTASNLHRDAVVGIVRGTAEYLQFEMWSISRKRLGWGRVYAGSNEMTEGRWA